MGIADLHSYCFKCRHRYNWSFAVTENCTTAPIAQSGQDHRLEPLRSLHARNSVRWWTLTCAEVTSPYEMSPDIFRHWYRHGLHKVCHMLDMYPRRIKHISRLISTTRIRRIRISILLIPHTPSPTHRTSVTPARSPELHRVRPGTRRNISIARDQSRLQLTNRRVPRARSAGPCFKIRIQQETLSRRRWSGVPLPWGVTLPPRRK